VHHVGFYYKNISALVKSRRLR